MIYCSYIAILKYTEVSIMAYSYEMRPGDSLQGYYRRIAKVADQRLVRLEKLADEAGYGNATQWAYKRAMRDIAQWSGEGATRFNTKPPEKAHQLQAKINDIKTFLGSESSTKSGIKATYQQRINTLNTKYGTKYQADDLQKLFSSSLWKKMETKGYDSDTIMKAIGYIQNKASDEDVLKGLQAEARKRKNVPEFTGDPFIDEAVRDMLRSKSTINEMYQYFKGI